MKRKTLAALAALLMALNLFLASCGKTEPTYEMDVEEVAARLATNYTYVDPLAPVDADIVATLYGFRNTVKICVYASGGATPEEVICAEYADEKAAEDGLADFRARLDSQKKIYDTYNAQYRPLLDDPLLCRMGRYVILCVSEDADQAEADLNPVIQ